MHSSKILIDINYINFAWGYQNRGVIIDNTGNVYRYIIQDRALPNDLETKIKNSKTINKVPTNMLQLIQSLSAQIRDVGEIPLKHVGFDGGATTYNLYLIDNKNNIKMTKLGQSGDWEGQNRDRPVSQLLSILDHYKSMIWSPTGLTNER